MDNLICIVDEKLDIGEKKISKTQQKFNEASFKRKKTGNIEFQFLWFVHYYCMSIVVVFSFSSVEKTHNVDITFKKKGGLLLFDHLNSIGARSL